MPSVAELEAAVVAGDKTITPAQIEKARDAERFDSLTKQAADREAREQQEQEKAAAIAALRHDVEQFVSPDDLAHGQTLYSAAVESLAALRVWVEEREAERQALTSRALELGLRGPIVRGGVDRSVFPEVDDRWRAVAVKSDVLEYAVQEAKEGMPSKNGRTIVHGLHTEERRAELQTVTKANRTKKREQFKAALTTSAE